MLYTREKIIDTIVIIVSIIGIVIVNYVRWGALYLESPDGDYMLV